jgi:hypothetical protein
MADTYTSPPEPALGASPGRDGINQPGQYPSSLFGVGLPQGTGAPGTGGASGTSDPTLQPGQYPSKEPISGVSLDGTGAPGSQGATDNTTGDQTITYSLPGFYKGEGVSNVSSTTDAVSGPGDWTAPPGNYPPQHPVTGSHSPTSTGAGQGRVMRGGRQVG